MRNILQPKRLGFIDRTMKTNQIKARFQVLNTLGNVIALADLLADAIYAANKAGLAMVKDTTKAGCNIVWNTGMSVPEGVAA